MKYVQVNIGRNIGDRPMSADMWEDFITHVRAGLELTCRAGTPIEVHRGVGMWGSHVMEESAHLSVLATDVDTEGLREELAYLADEFGQDAVALIVGSELVEARHD